MRELSGEGELSLWILFIFMVIKTAHCPEVVLLLVFFVHESGCLLECGIARCGHGAPIDRVTHAWTVTWVNTLCLFRACPRACRCSIWFAWNCRRFISRARCCCCHIDSSCTSVLMERHGLDVLKILCSNCLCTISCWILGFLLVIAVRFLLLAVGWLAWDKFYHWVTSLILSLLVVLWIGALPTCTCRIWLVILLLLSIKATLNDLFGSYRLFEQVCIGGWCSRASFSLARGTCPSCWSVDCLGLFSGSPYAEIFVSYAILPSRSSCILAVSALRLRSWAFFQCTGVRWWARWDHFSFIRLASLSTLLIGLACSLIRWL